jgi:CheY-like chemotaxis protein
MTATDNSPRCLVVDDDEDMRGLLVRLVRRMGQFVDQAKDGAEAVEALTVRRYDLMLLDLRMPRMGGEDVLRWLRRHPHRAEGLRVIVVSAWTDTRVDNLMALGADAVLPKPLLAGQLRHLVVAGGTSDQRGAAEHNTAPSDR